MRGLTAHVGARRPTRGRGALLYGHDRPFGASGVTSAGGGSRHSRPRRTLRLLRSCPARDHDDLVACERCLPDGQTHELEPSLTHLGQFLLQCRGPGSRKQ